MRFGQHLPALRGEADLSRAESARKAGVPVNTLRNWEGDRDFPGLAACLRLADVPGAPVERLAEGVDDPAGDESEVVQEKPPRVRRGRRCDSAGLVRLPSAGTGRTARDNRSHLSRLETGAQEATWPTVVALAKVFGVSCDAFLREPAALPEPRRGRPRKAAAPPKGPRGRPRKVK